MVLLRAGGREGLRSARGERVRQGRAEVVRRLICYGLAVDWLWIGCRLAADWLLDLLWICCGFAQGELGAVDVQEGADVVDHWTTPVS